MKYDFKRLSIPDLILVSPKIYDDERGFFYELYKESVFIENGVTTKFVQDNISFSKQNVIRGLHYQSNPKAQAKLVSVITGEIFDVAVDIRKNSSTYGKWVGEILSEENHKSLYIPEGFAHGFCVLSDDAYVFYKVTQEYSPEHARGITWNDSKLNITWPIDTPLLHEKDSQLPLLQDADNNFIFTKDK